LSSAHYEAETHIRRNRNTRVTFDSAERSSKADASCECANVAWLFAVGVAERAQSVGRTKEQLYRVVAKVRKFISSLLVVCPWPANVILTILTKLKHISWLLSHDACYRNETLSLEVSPQPTADP